MVQIYKVFVNNCFIIFLDTFNAKETSFLHKLNGNYKILNHNHDLINLLSDNKYFLDTNLIYICEDPFKSFTSFKSNFNFIIAGGGVVQNNKKLLMIYKNSIWDLPKGKLEFKESPDLAAIREVQEETNVTKLNIVSTYFSTYHIYRDWSNTQNFTLKETKWFLMKTESHSDLLIPQYSEGIDQVQWIPFQEIQNIHTYNSIKSVLKHFQIY